MSASQPPIANLDCNDSGLSTTSSVIALLTFLAAVILSIYVRIISMHRSLDKIRDLKDKIRDRQDEALRVLRDMSALRIGDQVEWEYWVENNADWERLSFDYTELYRKVGAKWFGSKEPHVLEGLVWFARWGRWTQKALEELLNAYEDLSDRSTSGSNRYVNVTPGLGLSGHADGAVLSMFFAVSCIQGLTASKPIFDSCTAL